MKKTYISALLLIAVFFIVAANTFKAPTTTEGFQNLKILPKDITKPELDSVMGHFAVSLGVRCNFCHAAWADSTKRGLDFASDKKEEKGIARYMMKMTADINTNFFNHEHSTKTDTIHEVVCYSCHHGMKDPDAKVFLGIIDSTLKSFRKK